MIVTKPNSFVEGKNIFITIGDYVIKECHELGVTYDEALSIIKDRVILHEYKEKEK